MWRNDERVNQSWAARPPTEFGTPLNGTHLVAMDGETITYLMGEWTSHPTRSATAYYPECKTLGYDEEISFRAEPAKAKLVAYRASAYVGEGHKALTHSTGFVYLRPENVVGMHIASGNGVNEVQTGQIFGGDEEVPESVCDLPHALENDLLSPLGPEWTRAAVLLVGATDFGRFPWASQPFVTSVSRSYVVYVDGEGNKIMDVIMAMGTDAKSHQHHLVGRYAPK